MKNTGNIIGIAGLLFLSLILVMALVYFAGLSIYTRSDTGSTVEQLSSFTGMVDSVGEKSIIASDVNKNSFSFALTDESIVQKMDAVTRQLTGIPLNDIQEGNTISIVYRDVDGQNQIDSADIYPPYFLTGYVTLINNPTVQIVANEKEYLMTVDANTVMTRILQGGDVQYELGIGDLKTGDLLDVTSMYSADPAKNEFTAASVNIISF